MKKLMIYLLLIPSLTIAQEPLDRYLEMAAENNPGLEVAFKQYLASLEKLPQVAALPDPQVMFDAFIMPVETRNGPQRLRVSASQAFPWFGTLEAAENMASREAKASYEAFLEKRDALFHRVRTAYFDIYLNKRTIELTENNLEILTSQQKLVESKVRTGKSSTLDLYRLQMERGDLENRLAYLKDLEDFLLQAFNIILNTGEDLKPVIPGKLWENDLAWSKEEILDSIELQNHKIRAAMLKKEALDFRKELASNQSKPIFKLGLSYTFIGQGPDNLSGKDAFMFPMLGISIPLYRDKYRAMVNEVIRLKEAASASEQNTKNELFILAEKTWKEYQDADRRIALYRKQLELARLSLNILESAYESGKGPFEEILRMERKVLNYGLELEKGLADKQASISFITYLTAN